MILANVEVAKFISSVFPQQVSMCMVCRLSLKFASPLRHQALLRRHLPAPLHRFSDLIGLASKLVRHHIDDHLLKVLTCTCVSVRVSRWMCPPTSRWQSP